MAPVDVEWAAKVVELQTQLKDETWNSRFWQIQTLIWILLALTT